MIYASLTVFTIKHHGPRSKSRPRFCGNLSIGLSKVVPSLVEGLETYLGIGLTPWPPPAPQVLGYWYPFSRGDPELFHVHRSDTASVSFTRQGLSPPISTHPWPYPSQPECPTPLAHHRVRKEPRTGWIFGILDGTRGSCRLGALDRHCVGRDMPEPNMAAEASFWTTVKQVGGSVGASSQGSIALLRQAKVPQRAAGRVEL